MRTGIKEGQIGKISWLIHFRGGVTFTNLLKICHTILLKHIDTAVLGRLSKVQKLVDLEHSARPQFTVS